MTNNVYMSDFIGALETIKAECERHITSCTDCVFKTEAGCGIRTTAPCNWNIEQVEFTRLLS